MKERGPTFEITTNAGIEEMDINLKDVLPGLVRRSARASARCAWPKPLDYLVQEEEQKLIDMDQVTRVALERVERSGIIFLDEIDKIAGREGGHGPDVSREGVQRDILPIVEGTTVNTRYGFVRTDHILFIAAGAFHVSKPSDLIPELQGRFPIRVELKSLTVEDFIRILKEPKNALVKQYTALLETEGIKLIVHRRRASRRSPTFAAQVNEIGGEHRRAAPAHHHGEAARRDFVRGPGSEEEDREGRRRLRAQATGRHREGPGPEPVYSVADARDVAVVLMRLAVCVVLAGCGSIGEPLYPALRIPSPRHRSRPWWNTGSNLDINFTIPPLTTEGLPLKEIGGVELRVGPSSDQRLERGRMGERFHARGRADAREARPCVVPRFPRQIYGRRCGGGGARYESQGAGRRMVGLQDLRCEAAARGCPLTSMSRLRSKGVALTWRASGPSQFRIFRKDRAGTKAGLLATATEPNYVDISAAYGKDLSIFCPRRAREIESNVVVSGKHHAARHLPARCSFGTDGFGRDRRGRIGLEHGAPRPISRSIASSVRKKAARSSKLRADWTRPLTRITRFKAESIIAMKCSAVDQIGKQVRHPHQWRSLHHENCSLYIESQDSRPGPPMPIQTFFTAISSGVPSGARLLPPCVPSKIVCVGRNYAEHAKELGERSACRTNHFLEASVVAARLGRRDRVSPVIAAPGLRRRIGRGDGTPRAQREERGCRGYILGYTLRQRRHRARPAKEGRTVDARQGIRYVLPVGPCVVPRDEVELERLARPHVRQWREKAGRAHYGNDLQRE